MTARGCSSPYPLVLTAMSLRRTGPLRRRGALLLEVVISISILLVAMGVVGLTIRNSSDHLERTERISRAMVLTEKLLTEIETGILDLRQREMGDFFGSGETIPGLSWRLVSEPDSDVPGLLRLSIQILNGDPNGPENEREMILETHVLHAEPKGINFEKDFGFDEDQIAELTDVLPGGEALFDPNDFDPRSITGLPMDTLLEILPQLLSSFGIVLSSGQLEQLLDAASRGDMSLLQNMAGTVGQAAQAEEARKEAEGQGEDGGSQTSGEDESSRGQRGGGRFSRGGSDGGQSQGDEGSSRFGQGGRRPDRSEQNSAGQADRDARTGPGGRKPQGRPR